jgi:uncharacterized membrane protein
MTAPHADQIISDYMSRLERALGNVPDPRRKELLDEVRTHIAEARSQLPKETDADLMNIVDRLGDPADTAAAEQGPIQSAPEPRRTSRALEIATIVLVPLFWPVGVILLWISHRWTTRDKVIGTLVTPGGYLGTFIVASLLAVGSIAPVCRTVSDETGRVLSSTCPSGGLQIALNVGSLLLFVAYVVGPVLVAGYLALRLQGQERDRDLADHSDVPVGFAEAPKAS